MPTYNSGVEVQPTATPTVVLGTAGAQGSANTLVASDATIPAFDATVPVTQASADAAATGTAAVAARRDHKHGMPTLVSTFAGLTDVKIVRKTADETVNNSITLQNDDELLFAIAANEVWEFRTYMRYNTASTPEIKIAITIPTGASINWEGLGRSSGAGAVREIAIVAGGTASAFYGQGTEIAISIRGVVVNGANAGNVQLQWAQNALEASDTKVLANSWLIAHRLA